MFTNSLIFLSSKLTFVLFFFRLWISFMRIIDHYINHNSLSLNPSLNHVSSYLCIIFIIFVIFSYFFLLFLASPTYQFDIACLYLRRPYADKTTSVTFIILNTTIVHTTTLSEILDNPTSKPLDTHYYLMVVILIFK